MSSTHDTFVYRLEGSRHFYKMIRIKINLSSVTHYIVGMEEYHFIKKRSNKGVFPLDTRVRMSKSRLGENNPNYGNKLSDEARHKLSLIRSGEKNPFYGKTHTDDTRKRISESHAGRKQTPEWKRKRARSGEQNGFWKGGISFEPYCRKFNDEFKERVRAFFGERCVVCGKTREDNTPNKRRLLVHHVNYDKMVCCNDVKPLFVCLCLSCHSRTNSNRGYWEEYFTKLINEKYNGECYFPSTSP